jgi:hypothetical protein
MCQADALTPRARETHFGRDSSMEFYRDDLSRNAARERMLWLHWPAES